MKSYSKKQIISEITSLLKYHNDEKTCLLFANLLLNKVNTQEEITLSEEEISNFLFVKDSNEINNTIFYCLSRLNVYLTGINFDGKKIAGFNFTNLNGVVINLDMIPDKDLSKVTYRGVTLNGILDNAVIEYTDFDGYVGNISIDQQKIINKSIKGSNLSGITIDGNFDGVVINGVDFSKAKGDIVINPQNVPNKELIGINFANVLLCSSINEDYKEFVEPSFTGCTIYECKFKDLKSPIIINLDTINSSIFPKLAFCDLTGVVVEGNAKSNYEPIHCVKEDCSVLFDDALDDLVSSYYYDEQGNYVHIHLYESIVWDDKNKRWKYVLRENESNLKFNVEFKKIEQQEKQYVLREDEHNLISQFVKATKDTVEKVKRLSLFRKR